MMLSVLFSKDRVKPFVVDTQSHTDADMRTQKTQPHTETDTGTDQFTRQPSLGNHRFRLLQHTDQGLKMQGT